ncbi:MAG: hypothetical protein E7049_12070 [Lentisphaerae bacterium]|nr:hypothetical protein [Lentisphaerota bacterium]
MMRSVFAALLLCSACASAAPSVSYRTIATNECRRVAEVSDSAMGVCLEGRLLYVIGGGTLYALDVADPLNPVAVGSLSGMDNNRQIAVSDGFAYVVSRETGMRIVDVSDPKNMKLRSLYDSVEFATGIEVAGKTAFVSERIYGVEAVDVSNPDRPRHIAMRPTSESQSVRYRDGYLYSGEWGLGSVTVFDAHDMRAFRSVGKIDLGGYGDGLDIDGRYLYCSTGHDARHNRADALNGGDIVGAGRGLDIFDLADPAKPRHVSRVDFPVFKPRNEDFWTVRVADGFAFCCDSHNGLFVVYVRKPEQPEIAARFCVPQGGTVWPNVPGQSSSGPQPGSVWPSAAISSVAVGEGCIYVTCSPGGLWVVPFPGVHPKMREHGAAPINCDAGEKYPTDMKSFAVYRPSAAGQARTACIRGDVVYAAFGNAGLHVVGICPDGSFRKIGELPGGRRVTDCCFVGDRLVTAEGVDGWAVYALDGGPAVFREVARRASGRKVAFWCWSAGSDRVVLSTRTGPYEVVDLRGFQSGKLLCKMNVAACQWNKYLPDGLVGNRLPALCPFRGLDWFDFSRETPTAVPCTGNEPHPVGDQDSGVCVFGARYLYTARGKYQLVGPDGSRSEFRDLPPDGHGVRCSGIPRSDGRLVVVTSRHRRTVAVYDFAEPDKPILLRAYTLSGNPDLAAFWHGRAVVPAGHQGLLLERLPQTDLNFTTK